VGDLAQLSMQYRYLTVAIAFLMMISAVGLVATGTVKFKAFPDMEGNNLEARVLLPQGTPLVETQRVVAQLLRALDKSADVLNQHESENLIKIFRCPMVSIVMPLKMALT